MVVNPHAGAADEIFVRDPFRIVSIRSVDAPVGTTGRNWHRYEICQGHNQIVGYRSGNLEKVTRAIEDIVFRLNDRRQIRRGRVHVVLRQKSKVCSQ